MTRALALLGIAYRLRRCRRLLRTMRLAEVDRVSDAVGRDLAQLRAGAPSRRQVGGGASMRLHQPRRNISRTGADDGPE